MAAADHQVQARPQLERALLRGGIVGSSLRTPERNSALLAGAVGCPHEMAAGAALLGAVEVYELLVDLGRLILSSGEGGSWLRL